MKHLIQQCLLLASLAVTNLIATAHQEPTSSLDLKIIKQGLSVTLIASTLDLAHDLDRIEPPMLLDPAILKSQEKFLLDTLLSRLHISADGQPLTASLSVISPIPEKNDLSFEFTYPLAKAPKVLVIDCLLFPYDSRHRTYINVYQGDKLFRQSTLDAKTHRTQFAITDHQSLLAVAGEFIYEGVHHIFIGPDHILFVVGLLLLGGSLMHLLKILTAFTVAHSITLCLATFHLVNPPASWIEPIIALSIVVVGIHTFYHPKKYDPRLGFAFGFGLIHGFGFASVLQDMQLPTGAVGFSLFSFNLGVEIGQACIVLVVAPLLASFRNHTPHHAAKLTHFAAVAVTTAGAFWFFQRILA